MLGLLFLIFLYLVVFILGEFFYTRGLHPEDDRKFVHIFSGLILYFFPFLVNKNETIILSLLFFLILLLSKRFNLLRGIHKVPRKTFGAELFPLGAGLIAVIFWDKNVAIFQYAGLILGFSDGIGGIIGKKIGKKIIFKNKTLEGSVAFFAVTVILFLAGTVSQSIIISVPVLLLVLSGSLLVTLVELVFDKGWDNIFVPLISSIILFYLL